VTKNIDTTHLDMTTEASQRMRALMREIADFVALHETIEGKLIEREAALEEKLVASQTYLSNQLARVKETLAEVGTMMTETGAARWRVAADKAMKDGQEHLQQAQQTVDYINQTIKQGCDHLEKSIGQTSANIAQEARALPIENFKQIVTQGGEKIKSTTATNIGQVTQLIQQFHWKNIGMMLGITLLIIFLTGLFLSDEWPWEMHQTAAKERNAGRLLLAAWPHLTPAEQQDVVNNANRKKT